MWQVLKMKQESNNFEREGEKERKRFVKLFGIQSELYTCPDIHPKDH